MESFRYPQFCPVARAAEVLGQRWNLLILRELFLGPQRFSDLQRRVAGVSTSVLAERLRGLEAHGVVAGRELPPPAASKVYELTPDGRALWSAFRELARWGTRLLLRDGLHEGDHLEPDWVRLAALCFAASAPTPAVRLELGVAGHPETVFRVRGGSAGTSLEEGPGPADASVRGSALSMLGAVGGVFVPGAPGAPPDLRVEGDASAARSLPQLFATDPGPSEPAPPQPKGSS